ncbi:MAG TPA: site-2 protease family protein [Chloroflexota bacterium]|jgi:Zn-dependent protease
MRQSLSLGRIFGIDVRVHATWLLAFAFVTWGLASGYFRSIFPYQQGLALPLLFGAISAVLLFASVLVHEISHSLVAKARGMRVRDITLFLLGGVSNIDGEMSGALDEFLISAVGPLTSFALAAVFWAFGHATTATPALAILNYLAFINLLLGVFNLLPAFPMDGGRVFRSVIWGITHRYGRATAIAATVGQVFGGVLLALGVVRIVFGDVMGGVWMLLIGWFLIQSAGAARHDRARPEVAGPAMTPAAP